MIHHDDVNTFPKVACALMESVGMSEDEAFRAAVEVRIRGVSTVATPLPLEIAQAYLEEIRKRGITSEIVRM